jgi:hypothetical protein
MILWLFFATPLTSRISTHPLSFLSFAGDARWRPSTSCASPSCRILCSPFHTVPTSQWKDRKQN